MKNEVVTIECDNTGLGTGPVDHDYDPEDMPVVDELVEAPLHWVSVLVVRVVPNPNGGPRPAPPPAPPNLQDPAAISEWYEEIVNAAQAEREPSTLVQSIVAHLAPAEAHKLGLAIPSLFDNDADWADLKHAVDVLGGGQ